MPGQGGSGMAKAVATAKETRKRTASKPAPRPAKAKAKPVAAEPVVFQRTIRVPLVAVEDETWRELRRLAYLSSNYSNNMLSSSYCEAKGLKAEWTTYTDYADQLSAAVRDALGRECVGLWRRLGKKILRGE